jgi:hypothetical protein
VLLEASLAVIGVLACKVAGPSAQPKASPAAIGVSSPSSRSSTSVPSSPVEAAPSPASPPSDHASPVAAAPSPASPPSDHASPVVAIASPADPPGCASEFTGPANALGEPVALGGRLYMMGHAAHREMIRFDPATSTWARLPGPAIWGRPVAVSDRIVVVGGASLLERKGKGSTAIFDPSTCVWADGPALPWVAIDAAVAVLDDRVYVAGGTVDVGPEAEETLRSVVAFRLGDRKAAKLPSMRRARAHAAMIGVAGNLYVFGGHRITEDSPLGYSTPSVEQLDLERGRWTELESNMPAPLYDGSAHIVGEGRVVIVGEPYYASLRPARTIQLDLATKTFSHGSAPPEGRGRVLGAAAIGGELYVVLRDIDPHAKPRPRQALEVMRYRADEWVSLAKLE